MIRNVRVSVPSGSRLSKDQVERMGSDVEQAGRFNSLFLHLHFSVRESNVVVTGLFRPHFRSQLRDFRIMGKAQLHPSASNRIRTEYFTSHRANTIGIHVQGHAVLSHPRLGDRHLRDEGRTVIGVLHTSTIAHVIIPSDGRATFSLLVLFKGRFFPCVNKHPFFVGRFHVRVVVVVTYYKGSVRVPIESAGRIVTLFSRLFQVNVPIVPDTRRRIFEFCEYFALYIHRDSPSADLLTRAFRGASVIVNRDARFLRRVLLFVKVFIHSGVSAFTNGSKVASFRMLTRGDVRRLVDFEFRRIGVVRTVLFTTSLQLVLYGDGQVYQSVCLQGSLRARTVNRLLRNSGLLFYVVTVTNNRSKGDFAFRTRDQVNLIPIIVMVLLRDVVIRISLRYIRLVMNRRLRVVAWRTR